MSHLIARPQKQAVRTSVIVPCCHRHTHVLPELLDHLDKQVRKPDEVVISVSGCPPATTSSLVGVRVLCSETPLTAGQNRNRASEIATGDIFIYQDADDLPHPQRVAIIAHLFETYEIEHLMHYYFYKTGEPISFTLEEAIARSAYHGEPMLEGGVTNGNVAIVRSVFEAVRWPEYSNMGEDQAFNRDVYERFERNVITQIPLLTYRHDLSTFR